MSSRKVSNREQLLMMLCFLALIVAGYLVVRFRKHHAAISHAETMIERNRLIMGRMQVGAIACPQGANRSCDAATARLITRT